MYRIERFTVPELVEEASRRYALRPALAMLGGTAVRYEELEPRTRRVAALLGLLGAHPGDRVALASENRPEWGLAYLGISRSGCVAVPILTDFTAEQMGNILEHSESRIVLCSRRLFAKFSGRSEGRIFLDVEGLGILAAPEAAPRPTEAAIAAAAAAFESPPIGADDLAEIVYTSGTTGSSKGVMLTHRNIIHNAWACSIFVVLRRTDRVLSVLPLAHTYEFTIGFIIPLMHGSAVYYLDRPPSASALLPALAAVRPTIMLTVPLVMEKVYRSSVKPSLEKIGLYRFAVLRPLFHRLAGLKLMRTFGGRLRFFGIGGAPLAPDVESFLHDARFPYSIGYGLTETAPLIAGNRPGRVRLHTTGVAASGVEIRIGEPRAPSGAGEIQVRGPNVTPGYYKDPERTAEAFTPDRWFRTGDLGFLDESGTVTVRGRLKTMILGASGENIYPEEVEALLNASPHVAESLVYGDESGLTALVQLKPELLQELGARGTSDGAENAAARLSRSVGEAMEHAGESLENIERAAAQMLELIKREANGRLAGFSRIGTVRIQHEPFEKTPTQKIKRFLYPRRNQD